VFLIGADEIDTGRLGSAYTIYLGHHGDKGASAADVVLPGAAYTEKHATYVNTEGRPQRAKLATFPPGEAKEDWRVLRALSEVLGRKVPLDQIGAVRARMSEIAPWLAQIDEVTPAEWGDFGAEGSFDKAGFTSPVEDFYLTNPISRASGNMRECSELFTHQRGHEATGTHG